MVWKQLRSISRTLAAVYSSCNALPSGLQDGGPSTLAPFTQLAPEVTLTGLACGAAIGLSASVAPPGGGASPPMGGRPKLCNMCVLSLSWNFFVSHDKYIARPSSKEPRRYPDNRTGTGDFVL